MIFERKHIISTKDFSRGEIDLILDQAAKLEPYARQGRASILKDRIVATLFYEPSTRTRLSFDAAIKRLGGTTIGFDTSTTSSVVKGETLADTIRMVESYSDVIVLRHPHEGAARLAAEILQKAGHQRRGRRRPASDPDPARPVHHEEVRKEVHRWHQGGDGRRPEVRPHRAFPRRGADHVRGRPHLRGARPPDAEGAS